LAVHCVLGMLAADPAKSGYGQIRLVLTLFRKLFLDEGFNR